MTIQSYRQVIAGTGMRTSPATHACRHVHTHAPAPYLSPTCHDLSAAAAASSPTLVKLI